MRIIKKFENFISDTIKKDFRYNSYGFSRSIVDFAKYLGYKYKVLDTNGVKVIGKKNSYIIRLAIDTLSEIEGNEENLVLFKKTGDIDFEYLHSIKDAFIMLQKEEGKLNLDMTKVIKKINGFSLKESIYIGKINLKDYSLVFDPFTESGWFYMTDKEDNKYEIEIKSNGKKPKDGFINSLMIFSPTNKDFDLDSLVDKIVYISNKNRFGYKFKKEKIVEGRYGLQPYGIISVVPNLKMEDFERVIASTKPINYMVKKGGDLDQFTF